MEERPLRYCDVCGGLDDHPRHVRMLAQDEPDLVLSREFLDSLPTGPISAVAELVRPRVTVRHQDCCAAQGCALCTSTETANEGRRGQELIDHLAAVRAAKGA